AGTLRGHTQRAESTGQCDNLIGGESSRSRRGSEFLRNRDDLSLSRRTVDAHQGNRRTQVLVLGGGHVQQVAQATEGEGGFLDADVGGGGELGDGLREVVQVFIGDTQLRPEGGDVAQLVEGERNLRAQIVEVLSNLPDVAG